MGGHGSGGRNAKGVGTVEQFPYLDVTQLRQVEIFRKGATGSLTWSEELSAAFRVEWVDGLILDFYNPFYQEHISQFVGWQNRPINFGVFQTYLVYPYCNENRMQLYLAGRTFYCRVC